jgi:hypothetical protein
VLAGSLVAACSKSSEWPRAHADYYQCVSSLSHQFGGERKASASQASAVIGKCDRKLEIAARLRARQRADIPALHGMNETQAYREGFDLFRGLALCRLSEETASVIAPRSNVRFRPIADIREQRHWGLHDR